MANVKMGDFLLQYYMQRRFNTMPAAVRAQFDEYTKSDDFRSKSNMKDWKKKLMHTDANGKLVENTMPYSAPPPPHADDITGNMTMTDDEWEKLFKAFQNAFRNMSANAESFKDNAKATSFLKENFGDPNTHLFANAVANLTAEAMIQGVFKKFLEDYKNSLEIYFKQWGLIDSDFSYSDLMSDIRSKKYNTDPAFQDKVKTVAQYLNVYGRQADFQTAIGIHPGATIPDFTQIENGFDSGTVDPNKLDYFKRNYKDFLNTLATESKVYDVFKQYDKGKISKHLDAAKDKVDYANQDSKDYVPPKRDDELTPWQQLKKNVSDTWSDYMDKYVKLRGDRLYFSNSAKLIFKALTGAKFQPTDGLGKLLDSAGEIKKNLQYKSPRAVDHFEWMEKTLGELKDTMPKAFAGALKNGGQMRALVSELILNAVRNNKIDEAKTAMEVLSVMKYGYTTSKIMDTLRADKELFTIFSDGNLSWNKNEGVKIVTGAMDQTMRAALLILGYTITIAGNAIRLNGSKFNGKTGRIKGAHDTWIADTNAKKTATQQQKAANETQKTDLENNLTRMRNRGLTENELDRYIDQYRQDIPILNQNLENQIRLLDQWLSANPTHSDVDTVANYLMQIQAGQNPTVPVVTDRTAEAHMKNISQIQGEIITRTKQLNRKINKRQEFENATQTIQMLNDQITKQNNALINWDNDHKDKYKELMAYWDLLETGRDSHTGPMYSWALGNAKKKQNKFNQNKNAIFASYLNNYSMAA